MSLVLWLVLGAARADVMPVEPNVCAELDAPCTRPDGNDGWCVPTGPDPGSGECASSCTALDGGPGWWVRYPEVRCEPARATASGWLCATLPVLPATGAALLLAAALVRRSARPR